MCSRNRGHFSLLYGVLKTMIAVKIYFKDEILGIIQPEELLHSFLLMANRKQFKAYLIKANAIEVKE